MSSSTSSDSKKDQAIANESDLGSKSQPDSTTNSKLFSTSQGLSDVSHFKSLINQVPTLNTYIDVGFDHDVGRYLKAPRAMKKGECFLEESPIVSWPRVEDIMGKEYGQKDIKSDSLESDSYDQCHYDYLTQSSIGKKINTENANTLSASTSIPPTFYEFIFPHLPWKAWAKFQHETKKETKIGILAVASVICHIAEQMNGIKQFKYNSESLSGDSNYNSTSFTSEVAAKELKEILSRTYDRLCGAPNDTEFCFADGLVSAEEISDRLKKDLLDHESDSECKDNQNLNLKEPFASLCINDKSDSHPLLPLFSPTFITQVCERLSQNTIEFHDGSRQGVFQLLALCNHSCLPNSRLVGDVSALNINLNDFNDESESDSEDEDDFPNESEEKRQAKNLVEEQGCSIQLVTTRKVKKGEPYTLSYLDTRKIEKMDLEERRIKLDHWNFVCKCKRCRKKESLILSERESDNLTDSNTTTPKTVTKPVSKTKREMKDEKKRNLILAMHNQKKNGTKAVSKEVKKNVDSDKKESGPGKKSNKASKKEKKVKTKSKAMMF